MRTWKTAAILSVVSMAFFTACDDEDDNQTGTPQISIPAEYISVDFESNAAAELKMTSTLGAFTSDMKAADKGNVVTIDDVTANWNNTTLKTATSSNYQTVVDAELPMLVTASAAGNYDWTTAPNNSGGHFEGRVFNPYGLECVQVVEKGLFGAALYNEANRIINTTGDNITAADIDRLVALFGTTPAFPNSDKVSENPDKYAAKYAARRTPSTGGLYLNIKKYFIEAKAYAAAGSKYNSLKALALDNLMKEWEKALAATTINYLYATVDKLSQTSPDDATIEDGMHAYSEGVGFLGGVYSVNSAERMISDASAVKALGHMNVVPGSASTSYELVQDATRAAEVADLSNALSELKSAYDFSNEEMDGFKKNWVKEEGR